METTALRQSPSYIFHCDTLRCPAGIPTHTGLTEMVLKFQVECRPSPPSIFGWLSGHFHPFLHWCSVWFCFTSPAQTACNSEIYGALRWVVDEVVLCAVEGFFFVSVLSWICVFVALRLVVPTTDTFHNQMMALVLQLLQATPTRCWVNGSDMYGFSGSVNHPQSRKAQWSQSKTKALAQCCWLVTNETK